MSKTIIRDIGWGSYLNYEGPYFKGKIKFSIGTKPTEEEKWLEVFSATESGHYDAINMYDRCVLTVGIAQWCEGRQFSVSDMLGFVAEKCGTQVIHSALMPSMISSNATFKKLSTGKWRFVFLDGRGEVNTLQKQQELFLGCDGLKGNWAPDMQLKAKQWAADMASIWIDAGARKAQVDFTVPRMKWFFLKDAKNILLEDKEDTQLAHMIRAAYASYAGNNPTHANNALLELMKEDLHDKWSYAWCIELLKKLTFNPKIAIYPGRYDKIRPVLERLWLGIILPKSSNDLKVWVSARREIPTVPEEISNLQVIEDSFNDEPVPQDNVTKQEPSNQPVVAESVVKAKHDELVLANPTNSISSIVEMIMKLLAFLRSVFSKKTK
jgi:hypothetical protein